MHLIPVHTPLIRAGDDLASILKAHAQIESGDILAVSSKVIATAEGTAVDLPTLTVSDEAREWSVKTTRSPEFMQAVLDETIRLNGHVIGACTGALLTELRPDGMRTGTLVVPNAGIDESNIEDGKAIGWPTDPVTSGKRLQEGLNRNCAVLITDSCVHVRRRGVTAFALTVCGFDPIRSEIGNDDLFDHPLTITEEATADQLATAANILMGNAAQSIPAVIIRDHGFALSDYCGWVDGIERNEDLFSAILR